jgi:hypothetical protein
LVQGVPGAALRDEVGEIKLTLFRIWPAIMASQVMWSLYKLFKHEWISFEK